MNKNKSISINQHYSKKKNNNYSRLLNNSTNSNINQSSHLDSTTIKTKHTQTQTQTKKTQNKSSCKELDYGNSKNDKRSCIHIQNYVNKTKVKARNHNNSFTSYLSSEQLLLHLSNKQLAEQDITFKDNIYNQSNTKQLNSTSKTFMSLLNKSKQKNSDSMQKNIPYSHYNHFRRNLLGNETRKAKHMNKSAYYAPEFKEAFVSSSLIDRLKKIECQMEEGLKKIKSGNEGNFIIKAKRYNMYKIALEKVTQELPSEYIGVLNKIIEGYHQIISVFISEYKKMLEYYDCSKTSKSNVI